jgi:hypothetical protein
MPDRRYPTDAIGNLIRKGDLLRVTLPEPAMVFTVADVEPAGVLSSGAGQHLDLQGTITLVVKLPVPFVGGTRAGNMLVLKKPEADAVVTQ